MDKIGIVILNYKNYDLTNGCIASVVKSSLTNLVKLEFYIVDNSSGNHSLEKIQEFTAQNSLDKVNSFYFIQSEINGGYAKGINLGIKKAISNNCNYIATINPDVTVKTDSINELYLGLKGSDYAMMGPKIYDLEGKLDVTCARREPTLAGYFFRLGIFRKIFPNNSFVKNHYIDIDDINSGIINVDIVSGAFMMFKSDVLQEIDYFDENTFLYNEEMIIHAKLKKLNYKTGINTKSIVYHLGGGSSQNVVTSIFLFNARLQSLEYYLRTYKRYSSFMSKLIILNFKFLNSIKRLVQ